MRAAAEFPPLPTDLIGWKKYERRNLRIQEASGVPLFFYPAFLFDTDYI